jgi:hypothetical protein
VLLVLGVLAELIAVSRLQLEETLYRTKRLELALASGAEKAVGQAAALAPSAAALSSPRSRSADPVSR